MEECFSYTLHLVRGDMLRTGPTAHEQGVVEEHSRYLKDLTDKGVVIMVGRTLNTDESVMGITVFRAASEVAARQIMNNDPAVKNNVMTGTLYPFRIALRGN
jgi:uncharacterized protein